MIECILLLTFERGKLLAKELRKGVEPRTETVVDEGLYYSKARQ
jgi:hypothetical protein